MKHPNTNFIPTLNARYEDYNATIYLKIDNVGVIVLSFNIAA